MVPGVLSVTDPLRRAEYCLLFRKLGRENCHICLYAPLTDRHTHEPFMVLKGAERFSERISPRIL